MGITKIDLVRIRRRGQLEAVALMQVLGNEDPASYAGERIVESFGRPTIHRGYLQDSDLRPETRRAHGGRARSVIRRISAGRPGRFTVDRRGQFLDYHGGHGFPVRDWTDWFTPEALHRGIGWYFIQTYRHDRRVVGRYKVIRIVSTRNALQVFKHRAR